MSSWQSHFIWEVTGPCTFHSALCKLHYYAWQLDVNSSGGDEIEGLKAVSWQWGGDFWLYQILEFCGLQAMFPLATVSCGRWHLLVELWDVESSRCDDHWDTRSKPHHTLHTMVFKRRWEAKEVEEAKYLTEGTRFFALTACLQQPAPGLRFLRRQPCMYWLVQSCPDGQRERRMQVHAVALAIRVGGPGSSIQAFGTNFPFSDGVGNCQCKPCAMCAEADQL